MSLPEHRDPPDGPRLVSCHRIGARRVVDARSFRLLRVILLAGVVLPVPFAVVDALRGNLDDVCISGGTTLLMGIMLVLLRRPRNCAFIATATVAYMGAVFFALLVSPQFESSAGVWAFVYPIVAMLVLGPRGGTIAVAVFALVTSFSLWFGPWRTFSGEVVLRMLGVYFGVAIVAYTSERDRRCNAQRIRAYTDSLRQATDRYRRLFRQSNDGVVVVTAESEIRDANPAACALLRGARQELIGTPLRSLADRAAGHEVAL